MNSDFFERLNDWIRNTESSIVNFLSAFAPWLAPIIPAYMTFSHAIGVLDFPFYIALPAALVVEILGFSAVSTFLAFWFYNRRSVTGSKRAPLEIVVIAFAFYLTLIVVSNVLLDATKGTEWESWAIVGVRALYTLQTIPAALIVAVRTQHRDLLLELSREKAEKLSKKDMESSKKVPDWRTLEQSLSPEHLEAMANWTPDQMRKEADATGFTYKTITNYRLRARAKLGLKNE